MRNFRFFPFIFARASFLAKMTFKRKYSGVRSPKGPRHSGCISGDMILFECSKPRRLGARNFVLILIFIPFTTHMKRPALQNKRVAVLQMAFRARNVFGTFEKRAPRAVSSQGLCWWSEMFKLRRSRGLWVQFPPWSAFSSVLVWAQFHQ